MSNNRELSEFADYLTVDDTTKNVGIGTTLKISAGGIFVGNTEIVRPDGTWGGPDTGLVGAQGAQGFQGAVGAQGAQGAVGAQGAQGAQGYQGAAGSATITNNADDRVITGGSGSNLNGEANLTFNGSSLRVNTTTSDAKLEVNNSSSKINIATLKTTGGAGSVAGLGFMVGQTSAGREKAALYFQETNGGAHYTGDLVFALNNNSGSAVQVSTSDERMRITSSGNMGLGVTPESWGTNFRAFQIGSTGSLASQVGARTIELATNAYNNGGWKYTDSDVASLYYQYNGEHIFSNASSGTDDASISFTERLRVRSDGVTVFGSGGAPYGSNTVSIHPDDGMVNFGMDGRDSFITGQNSCYIYSGSGSVGSILAGTLVLQSRSNLSRDIQFVTGATPTERLRINGSGAFGLSGANYGTSGQVLTSQGSGSAPQWATPSSGLYESYAMLRQVVANNTNGGTNTAGSWATYPINTESFDPDGIVSLSSNTFTLVAGTYRLFANTIFYRTYEVQTRLQNTSDSTTVFVGMSGYSSGNDQSNTEVTLAARFTISASKNFQIQYNAAYARADTGLGNPANRGEQETYAVIEIFKEA